MICKTPLLVMACVLAASAWAQTPISQNVDRAQLSGSQQPTAANPSGENASSDEDQIAASPNDPDLGEQAILKRSDRYQPFTFFASAPISYTSNVALSHTNEEGDFLFTPAVGFSYVPLLTRNLYANFTVGQQFFYYDRFNELDFGSFDALAGLTYSVPRMHNLILRAAYAFNRLTDDSDLGDEFFSSHSLNLGAEVPFRLGRAQQLSLGVDLSFNVHSDPEGPGRHEYSAFAAYSLAVSRSFSLNGVARLAVRDYVESDRTDVSGIFAVSANYRITKWLTATASANYATNNSNREVFDYHVANGGAALSLAIKF